MEPDRPLVMLDPATDDVLSVCAGPAVDGKCPMTDAPPYLCQGLHLVGVHGTPARRISFTVDEMIPGRCPVTAIDPSFAVTAAG